MEQPAIEPSGYAFRGLRSFVPWRGRSILQVSFPELQITDRSVAIRSGSNIWNVPWGEVNSILFDAKAILIRRSDGTSGRFKATRKTVRNVCQLFDERKVPYGRANGSTYWLVASEPKIQPPDRH